jgi:hypothetical protein
MGTERKKAIQKAGMVEPRILTIRGQKVILDSDLARLYAVPTSRFNEAVKRNRNRFPSDFIVVTDRLQDMVDTNFKFYKRITDDREFSKYFLDWLFDRLRKSIESERPEGNYTQK